MSRLQSNSELPFIKEGWAGNPLSPGGTYINLDEKSHRGFKSVLEWKSKKNPYQPLKKGQVSMVKVWQDQAFLDKRRGITWLGHASFLIEFSGLRILIDPVLYPIWPLKRFTDLPCSPEALKEIDVLVISHNHRDHLDKKSIKTVLKSNPNLTIFTGLGIGTILRKWGAKQKIVEAGWYQRMDIGGVTFDYLPARHWNRRYLWDTNTMLWGSVMIGSDEGNIYFGADSGMGNHFAEISKMYAIKYALLGIGAYEPRWFMKGSHTSPSDVVEIKDILDAQYIIPMHYGTFDLADEPVDYPRKVLAEMVKSRDDFLFLDIGKKLLFDEE